jgi:RNA-directed DNA polymerase
MLSYEARALAVRKITSNEGGKTPGVDNIVWSNPKEKYEAIGELRSALLSPFSSYKAQKIKRVWIPKLNSDKLRPLGIPYCKRSSSSDVSIILYGSFSGRS